jgi:hypothetical protein
MQELEVHLAKARFARRHVSKMAGIGLAAVIARLAMPKPAQARDSEDDEPGEDEAPCFLKGTKVQTITGERNVEDLAVGDLLPTRFNGIQPIQWIGRHRHRRAPGAPWTETIKPVRIAKDGLGPGVPYHDLFVSQKHCMFLDGILIPAGDLVNGSSISVYPASEYEEIEYLHIKLAAHDTIFAHGALTETLRIQNSCTIEMFENGYEYEQLYGAKARIAEIPCAAVVSMRGGRDRLRSRVRSALSPWVDRRNAFDKLRDHLEDRARLVV